MAGTSLHRFYVMTPKRISPELFLCNGQPHKLQAKLQLSMCNFWTCNGLHENCGIRQELLYECNVLEGQGKYFHMQNQGHDFARSAMMMGSRTPSRIGTEALKIFLRAWCTIWWSSCQLQSRHLSEANSRHMITKKLPNAAMLAKGCRKQNGVRVT